MLINDIAQNFKRSDKHEVEHIIGLNYYALLFERKYSKLIYPKPEDRINSILKNNPSFTYNDFMFKEDNKTYREYSGIYALTFNDKTFYVGETVNTFNSRITQHKTSLVNNKHYNSRLQKAFNNKGLQELKIYLLEYAKCEENYKGGFKFINLMREYYYQILMLQSNYGINNMEDSLKKLYYSPMFNLDYTMVEVRNMASILEAIIKFLTVPNSLEDAEDFEKQLIFRIFDRKNFNFYHYLLTNLNG